MMTRFVLLIALCITLAMATPLAEQARKETDDALRKRRIEDHLILGLAQPILDAVAQRETKRDECLTYKFTDGDREYADWLLKHHNMNTECWLRHALENGQGFRVKRIWTDYGGFIISSAPGAPHTFGTGQFAEVCW